jgi:prepilin-type processing-associated H-X9-DG protein
VAVYAWFYNGGRRNPEQYMKALNRSRITCNDGEHNLADVIGTTIVADALGFHGDIPPSQEGLDICSPPGNGINVLRLDGSVRRAQSNSYHGGD